MNFGNMIKGLIYKKPSGGDERRGDEAIEGGRRQGENPNPYLEARRTWNHIGAVNLASRQMFQLLGVLSLLMALSAVGGMTYIGSQSKFVPYVVQVDKLGQQAAVGASAARSAGRSGRRPRVGGRLDFQHPHGHARHRAAAQGRVPCVLDAVGERRGDRENE